MIKITSLDYKGYETLQKHCSESKASTNPWFESSYPVFINHSISNIDDIIPLIAYAYSWMPTIPTVKFEPLKNNVRLLDELKKLQSGKGFNLCEIMREMIPAINNSFVGTSKVLHFIAPETIAIIDSRVAYAWNEYIKIDDLSFPSTFSKQNIEASIVNYVKFNNLMNEWCDNIKHHEKNFKLRNLEFLLYRLGGDKIHPKKQATKKI